MSVLNIYHGAWKDQHDLEESFSITLTADVEILFADYTMWDLEEGSAYVLFRQGNKLYEVHAECYDWTHLLDQWEPKETSVTSLKQYVKMGKFSGLSAEVFKGTLRYLEGH